jgi:IMP dehydrogenase
MRRVLTFDDVALVPQYSNISSRTEPDLSTWLVKDTKIGMPLLAANMDTVICDQLADVLLSNGGFPIFHRFTDIEQQRLWIKKYSNCSISTGLNNDYLEDFIGVGASVITFDIAHGHSKSMMQEIEFIKSKYPHVKIIAGNVCTAMGTHDLISSGADAIKVGIGPGAACTTRSTTGFGVSQFSAIQDCSEIASRFKVPIIADGGIRNSRDIVLALAAGASTVMIGKLFALTYESAAQKRNTDFQIYAKYRGQASKDFQDEARGGLKKGTVAEGEHFWAPVEKSAQQLIDELLGGLRSALTYGGARTISELQRKAEFVEVTPTYQSESSVRK